MYVDSDAANGPIVVGIDLSSASKPLIDYAAQLAIEEHRPLHLVYVMPLVPEDSPELMQIQEEALNDRIAEANTAWRAKGLSIKGNFQMGRPAHEIIQVANHLNAAYIAVGTEAPSGLDRLLLGSVAEAVIRKSDRPVFVLGREALKRAEHTMPWKHLMLACEPKHGVTEAARLAGSLAQRHKAQLTIFSVSSSGLENVPEDQFALMEQMMNREAWLTVKPQCLIRTGDPAAEIVRMCDDAETDLLIMSVHSGGALLTHLRSGIVANVLRAVRCPVLILRDLSDSHTGRKAQPTTDTVTLS